MIRRPLGLIMIVGALHLIAACSCDPGETASCIEGSCPDGLVCDSGTCRPARSCEEVGCAPRQICEEQPGADAVCLSECEEGWIWQPEARVCAEIGATCEPFPAEGSILADCEAARRRCIEETPGAATCGDCLQAAEIIDPETGICRQTIKCTEVVCDPGEVCIQPPDEDAFCNSDCYDSQGRPGIPAPDGSCVLCPPCDGEGEAGAYLESLTGENRCICETQPGYYWQEGEPTGTTPCDRDGDGWVRFSARAAIDHDNPVVRGRARCDLRSIDRVILHNEAGQTKVVELPSPVRLFESDRNDDDDIIARHLQDPVRSERIPRFPDGRVPRATELNGLTKSCVSEKADYNDNGIEDVLEFHGMDTSSVVPSHNRPLTTFAYFIETHYGWYEPGDPGQPGAYHIAERPRALTASEGVRVPFGYSAEDGDDYWRVCARRRDSNYEQRPTSRQGMDFGWADGYGPEWSGMGHHSQFKCLVVTNTATSTDPPNRIRWTEDARGLYRLNSCQVVGSRDPEAGWDAANPTSPAWQCSLTHDFSGEGVLWGAVRYQDYVVSQPYHFGCVNECTESYATCAGCPETHEDCPGVATPGGSCIGDPDRFGKLFCGCSISFGGANCEVACPGPDPRTSSDHSQIFVDDDYSLTPRKGYWMCGGVTQTGYENTSLPELREEEGGYRLRGSIGIMQRVTGPAMCEDDGQGNCLPGGFRLQ